MIKVIIGNKKLFIVKNIKCILESKIIYLIKMKISIVLDFFMG